MPLNAQENKPKYPLINKIRQATANALSLFVSWIQLEVILAVFLVFAIFLAFLNKLAIGFYICFGLFIIGLFTERLFIFYIKRKYGK